MVPAGTKDVRLHLALKPDLAVQKYQASLQTLDGAEIRRLEVTRRVVTVPGRLLPPGDYLLNVKGLTSQGETANETDYYFTVTSK